MKFKNISKLLCIGILLNSLNLNSFAGTLSSDMRYETFEANYNTIDDILEEGKVDPEIEGNTTVNLVKCNNVHISVPSTGFAQVRLGDNSMIKPNTTYTVIHWAEKTPNHNPIIEQRSSFQIVFGGSTAIDNWGTRYLGPVGEIKDYHVGTLTTTSDYYQNREKEFILIGEFSRGSDYNISIVVLEGDWRNKDLPKSYFEGMMSTGEDNINGHKLEVVSNNKNFAHGKNVFDPEATYDDRGWSLISSNGENFTCQGNGYTDIFGFALGLNVYNLKPNTTYKISYKANGNYVTSRYMTYVYIGTDTLWQHDLRIGINTEDNTFTTPSDVSNVCLGLYYEIPFYDTVIISDIQIEEATQSEYVKSSIDKKEILLSEPLRALPNGVKDKIIKKNGQWVIERNINKNIISENSEIGIDSNNSIDGLIKFVVNMKNEERSPSSSGILCDKLINGYGNQDREYTIRLGGSSVEQKNYGIYIIMPDIYTLDSMKEWLNKNNLTVLTQRKTPIYEPINIDLSLNLFEGTTYILSSSNIPANIKVTVDRAMNRAVEAIELAQIKPTIDNISAARMWTNLLKETIKKDQLQDVINDVLEIEGLGIEKKSISANVDLYIKSKNTLSMSLNTNSIIFDDYSIVEDMEKLNAIEITVSSSLPYTLNAYLETPITNSDNSQIIRPNFINIKESKSNDYQPFTNINERIILNSNCDAGNGNVHNIDFKLAKNNIGKTDIYKATIKFEAIQK